MTATAPLAAILTLGLGLTGLGLTSALAGCQSGSKKQIVFSELPERATTATLAGPMCEGSVCRCLGSGGDPGLPERPGRKRFQIKLGPVENELWLTVDDMVLYKSVEQASTCFFVDLTTGQHPVQVHAKGENGVAARFSIAEIGAKGAYHTFDFECGGPGLCDFAQLDEFKRELARYKRHVHDPCGSTKIRQVFWQTGKAPDLSHPNEVQVELVLDVYEFAPEHASGDPACSDRY